MLSKTTRNAFKNAPKCQKKSRRFAPNFPSKFDIVKNYKKCLQKRPKMPIFSWRFAPNFPSKFDIVKNYKKCLQKHPKMPKIFSALRAGVLFFLAEIQIFKTGSFFFWRDPNLKNGVTLRGGLFLSPRYYTGKLSKYTIKTRRRRYFLV